MVCARFEVRLHSDTGMPEDDCVNVWHAAVASDVDDATLNVAVNKLTDFYFAEQAAVANTRLSYFFSPTLKSGAGATTFRVFLFDETDTSSPGGGPVIGAPRLEVEKGGEADFGGTPLPEEVAVCLSMTTVGYLTFPEHQSAGAPGPVGDVLPRARRRGRVFLGPLNSLAIDASSGRPLVSTTFRTNIADAFSTLHAAMGANVTPLQVFSRTDHAMRRVNGIWIDDAFDTIRRRGIQATSRMTRAYL